MKTLLIDPSCCIQCCNCQIACKDEHCDNDWAPIARPQGRGQFWIKIEEKEVATGAKMKMIRFPRICQHCQKPACMEPVPEAVYRRDDGIVIIDPEKAKGHSEIVEACPYGVIYWNEQLGIPQKCTLCAHLLDNGWQQPRCVTACPSDALRFVDVESLTETDLYAPPEKLNPEYKTGPTVTYVHLPKPFVGGTVINPTATSSIMGVKVTATHQVNGYSRSVVTDNFGDFDITGLVPGIYTLAFEKEGYYPKKVSNLDLREDKNVEEIRLYPLAQ